MLDKEVLEESLKKAFLEVNAYRELLWEKQKEKEEEEKEEEEIVYELSENEEKICKTLNENLPQLAPYYIYSLSAILGDVSTLLIAPKSGGKSKIMGNIKASSIFGNYNFVDTLTTQTLKNIKGDTILAVDDFSHFIFLPDSEQLLTPLASLIQKGSFKTEDFDIKANLVLIGGTTTEGYSKISRAPQYTSMLSDRIMRTFIIYLDRPAPKKQLPDSEFIGTTDIKIASNFVPDVSNLNLANCKELLANQISFDRTESFVIKLLKGHARLCNRTSVTQDDINFLLLFEPMFKFEPLLNVSEEFIEITVSGFDYKFADFVFNALKTPNLPLTVLSAQSGFNILDIRRKMSILTNLGIELKKDKVNLNKDNSYIRKLAQLHKTFR